VFANLLIKTHGLETLGVGYDGSAESTLALAAARELAARHGARIRDVCVVSRDNVRDGTPVPGDWPEGTDRLMHEAIDRLRKLGGDGSGHVVNGNPREELVCFGEDLDLLLIGSREYGPLGRWFHGHVSGYVARHLLCPLLVLPRRLAEVGPGTGAHPPQEPVPAGS
jgi:nucleotide-binding universal stress UspA family protein